MQDHHWIGHAIFKTGFDAERASRNSKLIDLRIAAGQSVCLNNIGYAELPKVPNWRGAETIKRKIHRSIANARSGRLLTFTDNGQIISTRREHVRAWRR